MSQSTTLERRGEAGSGTLTTLGAVMKHLCAAYISWRMEKSAIATLRSMSDGALDDIGLARSDIGSAVRGGRRALAHSSTSAEWQVAYDSPMFPLTTPYR